MNRADSRCSDAVPWERLAAYWLGGADDALEEHVFACEACTTDLERIAALGAAIRAQARGGDMRGTATPELLERLAGEGVRVRRYALGPGEVVHCSAGPQDDLVAVALGVPPEAQRASRLDLLFRCAALGIDRRAEDVPIAADGAIHWVEPGASLAPLPAHVLRVRLVAVDDARGERELAAYTFDHTPESPGSV